MVVVKGRLLLLVILQMQVVMCVKSVRLTRKTRPHVSSHSNPDPGHPTLRRWKRLSSPSSGGVGRGEVGVPRNLFPRLGVG